MKILIDAQLPSRLSEVFAQLGIPSIHVNELPKGDETPDAEIARYANSHGLVVATKDVDFYHSHMAMQNPKKLLLITTGNIKNRALFNLFRNNAMLIKNALNKGSFVELNEAGIITG